MSKQLNNEEEFEIMKTMEANEDLDPLSPKTNLSKKAISQIKAFEEYLISDGKAPKTLESYLFDVNQFMSYLATQGVTDVAKTQRAHVTDFIASLNAKNLRRSTINKKINSLSCFCKFLIMKSILPSTENPVISKEDRVKSSLRRNTPVSI